MFKINLSSYNIVGGIMLEFIMKYWIEFSFGLVISFITFLCKRINYYYKVMNSTKNGVKVLLKGEIIRRYNEYKKIGCLSLFDKEIITELYEEYKNLGGNGIIEDMIDDISEIPLTKGVFSDITFRFTSYKYYF